MLHSADPDETPQYASTLLVYELFVDFFFVNALTT